MEKKIIPIIKPWMDDAEVRAAARPIQSGWVTQGPEVRAFEVEFAAAVDSAHASAVSNCTTGLHLALRAAGIGPGDEVITASHTFIASANSIRYLGALPVFVDIEPEMFNMNPLLVEEAMTPKTRAILCVHQMGMPCDLKKILALAQRKGLAVIEDAACAIGSEIQMNGDFERIGKPHGDAACFSFHPRKVLTTGDGGMITTSHKDWDARFRMWRHNGMGISDEARHKADQVIFESYPELGYNYRMTDLQAAVGREQLKRLDIIIKRRRYFAARYKELLTVVPEIQCPVEPAWARSNWQSYCIRLPEGVDQRGVMQSMLDRGIATRRGIMCIHREPAYQAQGAYRAGSEFNESEKAQDHAVILPLYPQMTEGEQDQVVEALLQSLKAVNR